MDNGGEEEYLRLWDEALSRQAELLPQLVDTGLATEREKLTVQEIGSVYDKHNTIVRLRKELKDLDAEYAQLLTDKKHELGPQTNSDERTSRIVDFLMGIVVSLHKDFANDPTLRYIMNQLHLNEG